MSKTLRVLQVEDSESDASLILRALRKAGNTVDAVRVESAEAMRRALSAPEGWDVVIADYRVPQFDAPSALRLLQGTGLDIPFIVVSGVIGEEVAVDMMKAGAQDYLMKASLTRLPAAVEREVTDARLRAEIIKQKQVTQALREGQEKLRLANRELDRKIDELKQVIADKNVLFREVQHRVKNNLQVISSLLSLQSEQIAAGPSKIALAESRDRVRSIAIIHEQLSCSGQMAQIDFGPYIDRLVHYLLEGFSSVPGRIRVHSDTHVTLDLDDAMPCGLIVQELLSNSLKHAFPNQARGEICIELNEKDGEFHLRFRDNGVGFPPRFDISKTNTLGTQLISDLSEQLRGTFKCFNSRGAHFHLTFPAKQPSSNLLPPQKRRA